MNSAGDLVTPGVQPIRVRRGHPVLLFVARRVAAAAATLVIVSILVFMGTEVLPGDAAGAVLGRSATPTQVEEMRECFPRCWDTRLRRVESTQSPDRLPSITAPPGSAVTGYVRGPIMTPMAERYLAGYPDDREVMLQSWRDLSVLNRIGEPEEVAAVITFLLSDDARFVTGAVVNVDGGATARCFAYPPHPDIKARFK